MKISKSTRIFRVDRVENMPKANLWGDILMEQELTAQLEDALGAMETQGGTFCK